MKPTSIIHRLVILLITLMSAIGANAQEAYACYTSSNTTLTFYYDNLRSTRTQTTYDLNTGSHDAGWDRDGTKSYVTKVVFDPSFAGARPTSTYGWFYDMRNLQSIEGMSYLNTSEVTNMGWMFYFCLNLKSLDVSQFNTAKVTTMTCMFEACNYITTFDLSNWTTSNVTEMGNMFSQCFDLQTIYVGDGWSTAAVEYGTSMFYNCTSLVGGQGTTYDANHEDKTYAHIDGGPDNPGYFTKGSEAYTCYTSANKTLTFYYDRLRSTRSNTYNLNSGSASPTWYGNHTNASVTKVVFDSSFAGARPTTTFYWFKDMRSLETIEGMCYLNTNEVTNMASMFNTCTKITSIDLSSINTASVTDMGNMFSGCSVLQTIYVGDGWNTDAVTSSKNMFNGCKKLVGGKGTTYNGNYSDKTYARIDGGTSNPGYFTYKGSSGVTTGIENGQRDAVKGQRDEWYTLDGRKLSGEPTKKGVYIQNGKKTVVH